MSLGSNHTTTTTHANFIPELWASDVIAAAEKTLVMADLVTRFDNLAQGGGDVIHIPKVTNFSANAKSAETQVTLQVNTESKIDLNLDKHYETSFLIEDLAAVQANQDLRQIYTQKAGYAIAKQIDTSLLALYSGLSQTVDASGSLTDEQFDDKLLDGLYYLDAADAPDADRFFVIHPKLKKKMLDIDKFVSIDYRNNKPVMTGQIGDIYGFKVFVSTNVQSAAVSGTTYYHNLMFQKGAFGLAIQMGPRTQAQYKQEYLGWLVTVDVVYGVVELRDDHAVDFKVD